MKSKSDSKSRSETPKQELHQLWLDGPGDSRHSHCHEKRSSPGITHGQAISGDYGGKSEGKGKGEGKSKRPILKKRGSGGLKFRRQAERDTSLYFLFFFDGVLSPRLKPRPLKHGAPTGNIHFKRQKQETHRRKTAVGHPENQKQRQNRRGGGTQIDFALHKKTFRFARHSPAGRARSASYHAANSC